MIKTTIMISLTSILSTALIALNQVINKKKDNERNKMTPFECGFDPKSSSRLPFSTQFFLIGILFLIFDVEMVMILPMIITMKTSYMFMWFMTSMIITMILTAGIYYEWKNGVIQWIN